MKLRLFCVWVLSGVIGALIGAAAQSLEEAMFTCVSIADNTARLECFDDTVRGLQAGVFDQEGLEPFEQEYGSLTTPAIAQPVQPAENHMPDQVISGEPTLISERGFDIVIVEKRWVDGTLRLLGQVTNGNSEDMGVALELSIKDVSGSTLDSITFWPAGASNIASGGTRGISMPITRDVRAYDVDVAILQIQAF